MAGLDNIPYPAAASWPLPGKASCFEMVYREFGDAGFEYAKTLPIFTSH